MGEGKQKTPAERRQERLEEQLRGNLHKRKAQARLRRETGRADAADEPASTDLPSGEGDD
jgi:hypothetical protein